MTKPSTTFFFGGKATGINLKLLEKWSLHLRIQVLAAKLNCLDTFVRLLLSFWVEFEWMLATTSRIVSAFLGGGFKYFLFSPLFGEDSQFDKHIFQMGRFNHQPVLDYYSTLTNGRKRICTTNVSMVFSRVQAVKFFRLRWAYSSFGRRLVGTCHCSPA